MIRKLKQDIEYYAYAAYVCLLVGGTILLIFSPLIAFIAWVLWLVQNSLKGIS